MGWEKKRRKEEEEALLASFCSATQPYKSRQQAATSHLTSKRRRRRDELFRVRRRDQEAGIVVMSVLDWVGRHHPTGVLAPHLRSWDTILGAWARDTGHGLLSCAGA